MFHALSALYLAIRADCLAMKQLGCTLSHDEFANARYHLFKCIQHCIFESSIYVGIDIPTKFVLSLTSSPHITPDLEPLLIPMVIYTLLLSAALGGPLANL